MKNHDFSITKLGEVLENGSNFNIKNASEFNECVNHIVNLIKDAFLIYKNNSFPTCVFLSITIIEEVAKINTGLFTKSPIRKNNDGLRNHKTKQIIGANYTIIMGERLNRVIGTENIEKIQELAYSGKLIELRESSLYCDTVNGKIETPEKVIDMILAREMLLFAIESYDDNLVGLTSYSMESSKEIDIIFEQLASG